MGFCSPSMGQRRVLAEEGVTGAGQRSFISVPKTTVVCISPITPSSKLDPNKSFLGKQIKADMLTLTKHLRYVRCSHISYLNLRQPCKKVLYFR